MTARTYRALLVANSTFPSDPHNLPDLEGPRNDPALLRDALCDREAGLVPSDNVRLVTERTMSEVLREVEDFLRTASRQDTLILYYTGHGVLDQSNELFLCTRDTRSDRLRSTAVKASDVRQMIDESAAATTVILLDCCHSGRFKGGDLPATLAGRGRFVVTSSRTGELANDTDTRNHASLFTHHLVLGLLEGAEDRDGDGVVNLSELYDYVHAALIQSGRQVPQKRFEGDGDVPIALRTSMSSAHPQPELIDPALVEPELDVPETTIDLGEIDSDEVLPPERIAVVNRGGGDLEWTVESSASWVVPTAEDRGVVLRLQPVPGPNRANVYIRDTRTGMIKTVRVSVRVRSPLAVQATPPKPGAVAEPSVARAVPPVEPRPVEPTVARAVPPVDPASVEPASVEPPPVEPPPETFLGTTPTPQPARADRRALVARWSPLVAAVLLVLSGLLVVNSAPQAAEQLENQVGVSWPLLRSKDVSALIIPLLGGVVMIVAGFAMWARKLRDPALGLGMAVAITTGFARLADHQAITEACECVGADDDVYAHGGAGLWCLLAGVVCAVALTVRRAWIRPAWLPPRLVGIGVAGAVVWAWSSNTEPYRYYGEPYGSYAGFGNSALRVLLAAAVIGGIVAAAYLRPPVGRAALLGAIAVPVFAAATELIYIATVATDEGYTVWRIWPTFLGVAAMVGVAVAAWRRSGTQPVRGAAGVPRNLAA